MRTITLPSPLPSRLRIHLVVLLLCLVSALGLLTWALQSLQPTQETQTTQTSEISSPFTTSAMRILPILYQGRFRPMEAYSRLWLEERYGNPSIHKKDLLSFPGSNGSALDVLWRWMLHPKSLVRAPLFRISPHVRSGLERTHHPIATTQTATQSTPSTHLSYQQIQKMLKGKGPSSTLVWHMLLAHHAKALKNSPEQVELRSLAQGLFVKRERDSLRIMQLPSKKFSTPLHVGDKIALQEIPPREIQAWVDLIRVWAEPQEWKLIPPHTPGGKWLSQTQAPEEIRNILEHAQEHAQEANNQHPDSQLVEDMHKLSDMLHARYEPLAGNISLAASSLKLHYPTWGQLWAESLYVRFPGILVLLLCYACGAGALACFLLWGRRSFHTIGWSFLGIGWVMHTLLLLTRCYILGRPPVSNMFETVLYVPWIGMLIGGIVAYYSIRSSTWGIKTLFAASCSAFLLLSLIPLTGMREGMENVQAVLDSHFWLIIHVLMVVGSYGAFFISGLLAHGFLIRQLLNKTPPSESTRNTQHEKSLTHAILLTLYIGVALLIPGTLLGGVWAAQSWGRFWDWDPKESWACITGCIYLFVIHLYRFGRIQSIGLSFGSIIGLLAVSFTWYGVNYLLGVGLHSYGFGHGGETTYLLYLLAECLFLTLCALHIKYSKIPNSILHK